MESIENIFEQCDLILGNAQMFLTGYKKQTAQIEKVFNGATARLSEINLNGITTENTFHMEEHYIVDGCDFTVYSKRIKAELTLEDFMGLVDVEAEEGMPTLEHVEIVGTFANLFRKDYERMNPADKDINTYLKDFLTDGEYYHRGYHPFKDFLSAVADVTIILPLVESIVGYDFITGEELTGWERALKGGGAIFDIVTLGSSALIMNAAKAGA